ncbi:MAG: glycosyltransferase [Deltaproteobacteria bacterium]|nr:glycosyltransferase [Deltaproteobacteria bacterium]
MKKIALVLPTLNEKDSLLPFVHLVLDYAKTLQGYTLDIVISDSGSIDGTAEMGRELAAQNPRIHFIQVERGLGVGLIKGHQYSLKNLNPDILAQIDADGQVEIDVLGKLVQAIEEGYDLALGSRFIPGGKNLLSFSRRFFSLASSIVCRFIMGPIGIREFTNSARAFTPSLFEKINLERLPWRQQTFIIQPAFLNEAILAGAHYKEVPLVFKDRGRGYSKNKFFHYSRAVLAYAVAARFRKIWTKFLTGSSKKRSGSFSS